MGVLERLIKLINNRGDDGTHQTLSFLISIIIQVSIENAEQVVVVRHGCFLELFESSISVKFASAKEASVKQLEPVQFSGLIFCTPGMKYVQKSCFIVHAVKNITFTKSNWGVQVILFGALLLETVKLLVLFREEHISVDNANESLAPQGTVLS